MRISLEPLTYEYGVDVFFYGETVALFPPLVHPLQDPSSLCSGTGKEATEVWHMVVQMPGISSPMQLDVLFAPVSRLKRPGLMHRPCACIRAHSSGVQLHGEPLWRGAHHHRGWRQLRGRFLPG